MVREICKDEAFLAQKAEPATADDLGIAQDLFSEYGYDSVSVGQIAQAVGIKAPSLYNHFPGKQAIFDAIVESTAARYAEGTDRLSVHVTDPQRATFPSFRR